MWNWLDSRSRAHVMRRPRSYRPRLELLEARTVLAPLSVFSLDDSGPGSLRQAILDANATPAVDDTITIAVSGTINLASALPDLSTNINIAGPGASLLTVRRNTGGDYRIFTVTGGATAALSGLTITNGQANHGGGILNAGALTLDNANVSDNLASDYGRGAGIYNMGALTVMSSTIGGNITGGEGGGIYNQAGTVSVTASTLIANDGASGGGGIMNASGTVIVTASTLSGNIAAIVGGGGIYNAGTLTVATSTFSGNEVWWIGNGGGILYSGDLTVTASTFTRNFAADYGLPSAGLGGGIYSSGTLHSRHTIVAGNTTETSNSPDFYGNLTSWGYNLFGDTSGGSGFRTDLGDLLNVNPLLGPLRNNGGLTSTHALLPGSPAIDAGDPAATGDFDQLGFARIIDGNGDGTATIDIGAFELQTMPGNIPPVAVPQTVTANEGTAAVIHLTALDANGDSLTYAVVSGPDHGTLSGLDANLTYLPTPNYSGPDSFTFQANDGLAESNVATITITVAPVNDPPSFTLGSDQHVTDESGPQVVNAWATAISAGPPDEASQSLTFQVTSDNSGLFDVQPAVNATGTLSYTPRPNASGVAAVTVRLIDSGGTAVGGVDTSGEQTFTISVAKPRKWYNTGDPLDVNDDAWISPLDALIIFNRLNDVGPGEVPADAPLGPPFLDATGDNVVSPLDALLIFNVLNNPEGEGEGAVGSEARDANVANPGAAAAEASLEVLITLLAEEQAGQLRRRRAK